MNDPIRSVMLECVQNSARQERGSLSREGVLAYAVRLLRERKIPYRDIDLLECWDEFMRSGMLCWGMDLANQGPSPSWAHVTERGQRSLERVSRAPENPTGYLASISAAVPTYSVARSYIAEALNTYNAGCFKATAVLAGAAAEALVLDLRDRLVERMEESGRAIPATLKEWRIKIVRDEIERQINSARKSIDRATWERFEAYWPLSEQLRITRNDAGHPKSVEPVTADAVHASLLIFPEFARLVADLCAWIPTGIA